MDKTIIFISASRTGHNFIINQVRSWVYAKMINYENVKAEDFQRTLHKWIEAGQIDDTHEIIPVLIMRDLLNWWASYLKFVPDAAQKNHQNVFDVWVSHVKEAARLVGCINGKINVMYDTFNEHRFMRESLCDSIGGVYSEDRIDEVLEAGRGSSFDGIDMPGSLMNTDVRYMQMKDNKYWIRMLSENPEAVQLYKDHFKLTKEQEHIIEQL